MEAPDHRKWMYNRVENGSLRSEFCDGVVEFMEFITGQPNFKYENQIRCPCKKCKCLKHHYGDDVMDHLMRNGFMPNYYYWTRHGEALPHCPPTVVEDAYYGPGEGREEFNPWEQMVMDHAGPSVGLAIQQDNAFGFQDVEDDEMGFQHIDEDPNTEAKGFYEMLAAAKAPLWDGCEKHSALSATLEALSIKSDYNFSEGCFNRWVQLMEETQPRNNYTPKNLYHAKKFAASLGLGVEKIECCLNGCMLYRNEYAHESVTCCRFCGEDRYNITNKRGVERKKPRKRMWYFPITPRLQRMYSSIATAPHMRWHGENERDPNVLCHPSDGLAWKHFDVQYPEFSKETRNVRLGLCADGFNPFGQYGQAYSCWPVILTPYNLPPGMCMKREFMFLSLLIPGPKNPKGSIDVYLQPLIEELINLWNNGVVTYDVSLRENFIMKAALMWTINDFPAYGMLSGWMTAGKLACPCCLGKTKGNRLKNSAKISWFDCHRKFLSQDHPYRRDRKGFTRGRVETTPPPLVPLSGEEIWEDIEMYQFVHESGPTDMHEEGYDITHNWFKKSIFWMLPYWITHLLRHNIDVMHTERNVFMNVFDTVMDVKGKTKDTYNGRYDVADICHRKELELKDNGRGKLKKPKGKYVFNKAQRVAVCEWAKQINLPDGYASNLSRCVNVKEGKLHGMKSHDCHVFMQRLLPIAFASLPSEIWKPLVELSQFFRVLTSTALNVEQITGLERDIPVILCKLEKIFPPTFFDSMEHLPIHLPYEARLGGPVQYRWMYPFERFLRSLKDKVKNKARVEGSICEAYLVEEASSFASFYYPSDVQTRRTRVPRNLDMDEGCSSSPPISIFNYPGRACGASKTYFLDSHDVKAIELYVLQNCEEVEPYLE